MEIRSVRVPVSRALPLGAELVDSVVLGRRLRICVTQHPHDTYDIAFDPNFDFQGGVFMISVESAGEAAQLIPDYLTNEANGDRFAITCLPDEAYEATLRVLGLHPHPTVLDAIEVKVDVFTHGWPQKRKLT